MLANAQICRAHWLGQEYLDIDCQSLIRCLVACSWYVKLSCLLIFKAWMWGLLSPYLCFKGRRYLSFLPQITLFTHLLSILAATVQSWNHWLVANSHKGTTLLHILESTEKSRLGMSLLIGKRALQGCWISDFRKLSFSYYRWATKLHCFQDSQLYVANWQNQGKCDKTEMFEIHIKPTSNIFDFMQFSA